MISPSRRQFLTALACFAASTSLPFKAFETLTSIAGTKQNLIDVHHHILPPAYLAKARELVIAQGQGYLPASVLQWAPENSLAEMDQNDVTAAIVSISTPGIWFGDVQAARTLARQCNEYSARLVRDHPTRFGFFAAVPLPDTEGSLREITYALDVLKADGIGLMTSYGDKWPGDPAYAPVFEELNRRKSIVYVHPTGPNCCRDLIPHVPYVMTELPHDTTRAVTSLLFSGSFARFRDVRFIFSHAGGTLPMVAGRITRQGAAVKELAEKVPNGVEYELKRLYYEIAGSANRPAMSALMNLVPTTQIMFGSDYPWGRTGATLEGLNKLRLSSAEVRAIGRENSLTLFPRLRTRRGRVEQIVGPERRERVSYQTLTSYQISN
jgi:predicted TIM-barrel fold metal-dependent hydrolase